MLIEGNGLLRLAELIKQRNAIENEIAAIIDRPAHPGHIGEFVAAKIFDVGLMESATHKGIDGHFRSGPLIGQSVNIKKYSINEHLLDITIDSPPDFYLALTGPRRPAASSCGTTQPWTINGVFLFEAGTLIQELQQRRIKIGTATSVRRQYWDAAEIYPSANNALFVLTSRQRSMIEMFKDSSTS